MRVGNFALPDCESRVHERRAIGPYLVCCGLRSLRCSALACTAPCGLGDLETWPRGIQLPTRTGLRIFPIRTAARIRRVSLGMLQRCDSWSIIRSALVAVRTRVSFKTYSGAVMKPTSTPAVGFSHIGRRLTDTVMTDGHFHDRSGITVSLQIPSDNRWFLYWL